MNRLRSINPEQFAAIVRTLIQVAGGIVAYHGLLSDQAWALYSGAFLTVATLVYGVIVRSDTNLIKSAADVPAVEKVVTEAALVANAIDRKNVTSH